MAQETKNRERLLLILAGTAAVLYIAYLFVLTPLGDAWAARQKKIAELKKELEYGTNLVSHEDFITAQWDKMRTNALPSNTSQAEAQMFKSFDRWERAAGITRVSIKPQLREADDDYMTLECRADYTGDMEKVSRFLYEVEKDPMGVRIQNLEITSADDSGQKITLGLQVSGLILNPQKQPDQQP